MKLFKIPYVRISSVEQYFELPKKDREYKGFYCLPFALPSKLFRNHNNEKTWEDFFEQIKAQYPIQYFFRQYLPSLNNPFVYNYYKYIGWKLRDFKYACKLFFNPLFPRWRKILPRHKYSDVSELVVESNFSLILDFYYEEVVDGFVDWEANTKHKKFLKEIKEAVHWIESERHQKNNVSDKILTKVTNNPKYDKKGKFLYKETYQEHNDLEQEIFNKNTKIINWFVKNRQMFWS
jgi:hypothetical protein